jgi:hemoglobin
LAERNKKMDAVSDCPKPTEPKTSAPSSFELLGGEEKLKPIINTFIDRVFEDRMIGFFFRSADRNRIKEMEYQLAAEFLGAPIVYRGKALELAHAKHPIMGGHFARRRQILKETLEAYAVPEPIKEAWLQHTDSLRPLITSQADSECSPIGKGDKVRSDGLKA